MEGNWKTLSTQKLRNVKTSKITTKDVRVSAALQSFLGFLSVQHVSPKKVIQGSNTC